MEDRSTLLKVYNDRTTILNKVHWSLKEFLDYLAQRALHISKHLLSYMANSSHVSGTIRGELLIEGILQYLKGKRDYKSEALLLDQMFQQQDTWTYSEFRDNFSKNFESLYENNEVCRILQLVKRFGLDSNELVTYEYFSKLVRTSQLKEFDLVRNCKSFAVVFRRVILISSFSKIKTYEKKIKRKPLEIISNITFSISSSTPNSKPQSRDFSAPKSQTKESGLRSKLFFQAYKNFTFSYTHKILKESFLMIKNPYKFRDPYVHRAIFKVYLRFRNKACEVLSKALMKWNNLPDIFIDCVKDLGGTTGFTRENTVGFSKQYSFLTLTHEYIEKNYKTLGVLLQKVLKTPINRVKAICIKNFFPELRQPIKNLTHNFRKSHLFTLQKSFNLILNHSILHKSLEALTKKQSYMNKRQKYSIPAKGKKIATRVICKFLKNIHLKKYFKKFRTNTRFPNRKLSRSFVRTVEIDLPKKPEGLSKSFVASNSYNVSPKIRTKYEDMKNSVNKIKITHGFKQLWMVLRKLQQKKNEKPVCRLFNAWKNPQTSKALKINLNQVKSSKYHHAPQFSFRDKSFE